MMKVRTRNLIGAFALLFSMAIFANPNAAMASALTAENVVTLINQSRSTAGLDPLTANAKLTQAAQAKAQDMLTRQYFDHVGPDGRGPSDWIEDAGYDWTAIAENIAYGYTTAESVHSGFMSSAGHRANILGTKYEHVGVGAVSGMFEGQAAIMVVEEFGATNAVELTTYTLVVNNGTGDGSYAQGQKIAIRANTPATGKVFDKWTGDTGYIASVTSAATTVTVPNKAIALTATYKDVAVATYALTVVNGFGGGNYAAGKTITVTADAPATGKVFDQWTGDTTGFSNVYATTATMTMPAKAVAITATYKSVPTFALVVTSGSGSGSYIEGKQVSITASTPAAGKVFDKWTGSTAYVAGVTSANTTVTMPGSAIALTATYKDVAVATYALTVANGSGQGSLAAGKIVTITANQAAAGKVFDQWTGDVEYVSNALTATATVTMPAKAITLTATYKEAAVTTYALTVNGGTGDGSYALGTSVAVTADAPSAGKVFDKWTGDTGYISGTTSPATAAIMPAKAITLTATYKDAATAAYNLTVAGGTGSGSYTVGAAAVIQANTPAAGKMFDQWTGYTTGLNDVHASTVTLTMPAKAVTITATYKTIPTYTLVVTKGSGSGAYAKGKLVSITANAPAAGKIFDKWTGSTSYISSINTSTATVTMPAKTIYLTANYVTVPVTKFILTVNSGSGDGSFVAGSDIAIKADAAATGKVFDKWTGDTDFVFDIKLASTKVTMPKKAMTVSATYKNKDAVSGYADGTLVKTQDSPKVYVIIDGKKKWISIPEVFEQLGYKWTNVTIVSEAELASYPDYEDSLIRLHGGYKVYLVVNGMKRHILNPSIFLGYGFKWGEVKDVDQSTMEKYASASLIKESGKTGIYSVNSNGIRKLIPTTAIFNSYGYKTGDIQIVSKTELESYPLSQLVRQEGSADIYLVINNVKRHIASATVFNKYKYDWSRVVNVNKTEFDNYTDGGDLR